MSKILFILNDPPYGTERCYNGLRLAGALARLEGKQGRLFGLGLAVAAFLIPGAAGAPGISTKKRRRGGMS